MYKDIGIQIYADGADISSIRELYNTGYIDGFTTNPTLMKKAGVRDYENFAREILGEITNLPFSFEVLADDFVEMERQARKIGSWGDNVFIKIPITNTRGESSAPLIAKLSGGGLKLNVTAILTETQVNTALKSLAPGTDAIISVFAGRIADTGIDPQPLMRHTARQCRERDVRSLWASTRELLNIFQAQECGIDIITVTPDILKKLPMAGMDLGKLSLETVEMFVTDAAAAGFTL